MTFEVTIDPVEQPSIYDAIDSATLDGLPIHLVITPPWTEYLFEPGDEVQVPFDHGMGPAEVIGVDATYVRVKYGPRKKYTTSIERTSVETARRAHHPARVTVRS